MPRRKLAIPGRIFLPFGLHAGAPFGKRSSLGLLPELLAFFPSALASFPPTIRKHLADTFVIRTGRLVNCRHSGRPQKQKRRQRNRRAYPHCQILPQEFPVAIQTAAFASTAVFHSQRFAIITQNLFYPINFASKRRNSRRFCRFFHPSDNEHGGYATFFSAVDSLCVRLRTISPKTSKRPSVTAAAINIIIRKSMRSCSINSSSFR